MTDDLVPSLSVVSPSLLDRRQSVESNPEEALPQVTCSRALVCTVWSIYTNCLICTVCMDRPLFRIRRDHTVIHRSISRRRSKGVAVSERNAR